MTARGLREILPTLYPPGRGSHTAPTSGIRKLSDLHDCFSPPHWSRESKRLVPVRGHNPAPGWGLFVEWEGNKLFTQYDVEAKLREESVHKSANFSTTDTALLALCLGAALSLAACLAASLTSAHPRPGAPLVVTPKNVPVWHCHMSPVGAKPPLAPMQNYRNITDRCSC